MQETSATTGSLTTADAALLVLARKLVRQNDLSLSYSLCSCESSAISLFYFTHPYMMIRKSSKCKQKRISSFSQNITYFSCYGLIPFCRGKDPNSMRLTSQDSWQAAICSAQHSSCSTQPHKRPWSIHFGKHALKREWLQRSGSY